ncbi:MAG: dephospho-CoA kinase [Thermomicrobiales bacterium]|nr:dephospho-CoA kinase [Thermomicrobiales bacterium]MCO5217291.1 dephospho-CoA kinase [Thermomicrobiales bacterium]MCO5224997.1 dephospho-CoA kinase [Thermomicrobiales bacterium]
MPRFILGVTGNIATGKSTVVRMLGARGAHHIDADAVYHELITPGMPLLRALVDHYGDSILADDGSLNRKALGAIVFSDPVKLAELDALTHPAVIAESDRRAFAIDHGVVILDAVKLIESGHAEICDAVWLVTCPEEIQVQRLMARNNLDEAGARRRIAAQPPLAPKRARADLEIVNDGSLEDLEAKVAEAWETIPTVYRR